MSTRFAATDAATFEGTRGGVVSVFDPHIGLGYIRCDDGAEYLMHCISIADGSRNVAVGQRVEFSCTTRFGRAEATRITKLS